MLAILFQEKTKKMLVFPKNAEKNASIIEKGLLVLPSFQVMAYNRKGAGPYNDKVYQMTDGAGQ